MAAEIPGGSVRAAVWVFHLGLPLAGLWVLVTRPELDVVWHHPTGHFWLVLGVAGINVGLSVRMGRAAREHADARIMLISLAFLASAGFFFVHALATPGVLAPGPNLGFVAASRVGLFVAAIFALVSSVHFTTERSAALLRHHGSLRGVLALVLLGWAAASLLPLPMPGESSYAQQPGILDALPLGGAVLYLGAVVRYFQLYRRRPTVMLASIITAFTLLAEASLGVVLGSFWHVSWWLWHLLMAAGFVFVAYSARVQYQREGSTAGLFDGLALEQTVRQIRQEHKAALEELVAAMRQQEQTGSTEQKLAIIRGRLAARFGLTERQTEVLTRAAEALTHERAQQQRLAAMAAIGQDAQVACSEQKLLKRAVEHLWFGFEGDTLRLGLLHDGRLDYPPALSTCPGRGVAWNVRSQLNAAAAAQATLATLRPVQAADDLVVLPLVVKDHPAGVLEVRRHHGPFTPRDYSLLQSLASQLSIAVENARLYHQLEGLFRQYMSPDVATALLADPGQAALGGAVVEVSALFADLRGFTSFSEHSTPQEIVEMLNRYFEAATPCVLDNGGTLVQFVGDALMALFNAPARQSDHPLRAARAALALQAAVEPLAAEHPGWPRFRVGINSGPALVGNIGSSLLRSFNAMGDAVNVAARLEAVAQPGQVVVGAATYALLRERAEAVFLGEVRVKGRAQPVGTYLLTGLRDGDATG